ncbi:hypothetical protein SSX86_010640 [Deinandra increscens subsp. villosa]|uniref:TIR domain-containing protein n=1 Tax=Deinandra increscens subsp. villosa TaxID=3103831 RepID=A0AAP0D7W6_9ASTR
MAATASSSTPIVSPATNHSRYDVFLSFNEDTRFSFTDHLFEALIGAGIRTFRADSTELGEELNLEIERAITVSRASIVVVSENYANSASCLDELVLIMERRKGFYHVVIPVFYHVDPSGFRKQENICALKVICEPPKWAEHKVEQWKVALMEVANLSDKALSGYVFFDPNGKLFLTKLPVECVLKYLMITGVIVGDRA